MRDRRVTRLPRPLSEIGCGMWGMADRP